MRIGIIGTRGIPNKYGGFEQFAQEFSTRLVSRGHEVVVYASHRHPVQERTYRQVQVIHCYDPEHRIGTAGQFVYDFNCIRDARKRNFDVILQLGYTSSTIWSWLYPNDGLLVTNMDGLEWSRSKYGRLVQGFLKYAERWGVQHSDRLIADSPAIQAYLQEKYGAASTFVAYGADLYEPHEPTGALDDLQLAPLQYDLVIARFEPENNIEAILKAYAGMPNRPLVLVGNFNATEFGRRMHQVYHRHAHIRFAGGIYEREKIDELRYCSRLYIHGHSVGGTNPSLLEAMGCNALICAHDNAFNRHVLQDAGFYFKTEQDLAAIAAKYIDKDTYQKQLARNRETISNTYSWDRITEQLEAYFTEWLKSKR